jgi:hypothetical protein
MQIVGSGLVAAFFLMQTGLAVAAAKPEENLPEARAYLVEGRLTVDGWLDDPAWLKAGVACQLWNYKTGEKVKEPTEFRVLYSQETLYFGITCWESQMKKTFSNYTLDEQAVYLDDAVEIFLAPSEKVAENEYFHFSFNILGKRHGDMLANLGHMVDWQVKTVNHGDKWTAEVAIPFSVLMPKLQNQAFWRLNVCRNENPSQELSSWSVTDGGFHSPYRFGKLSGIDFNGKFITLKSMVEPEKSLVTDSRDLIALDEAVSKKDLPLAIIPQPVRCRFTDNDFSLNPDTRIVVSDKAVAGNLQAAREINQELKEVFGMELPILKVSELPAGPSAPYILLGEPDKCPLIQQELDKRGMTVNKETPGPEGYILQADKTGVLIAGSDDAGTYYGVQSLKQLFRRNAEGNPVAKGAEVWDKPYFKVRMVHFYVDKTSPVSHRRLIERIFSRYKYNHLLIEAERGVIWDSAPDIKYPYSAAKSDIKPLVQFAKDHYLKITPDIASLGHCDWIFKNKNYWDFVEDSTSPHVYCPLNPKSYNFIFNIFDECYELFGEQPWFHIGHDEHDMYHTFPTHEYCKQIGNEKLYYADTIYLRNYWKNKGVRTLMWGDIFFKPSFQELVPFLPKDILICDWHYGDQLEYPSLDMFQAAGLDVLGCTWYSPRNIAWFSQYAAHRKALGMMYTTWAGFDSFDNLVERERKQVMGYITQADYAWNPLHRLTPEEEKQGLDSIMYLKYDTGAVLRDNWYPEKRNVKTEKGFALNLAPYLNTAICEDGKKVSFAGYGAGNDLSALAASAKNGQIHLLDNIHYQLAPMGSKKAPGAILLKGDGVTSKFPSAVTMKVNGYAREMNFLHGTLYATQKDAQVAEYVIHYADGASLSIPLKYETNISGLTDWNSYLTGEIAWSGVMASQVPIFIRPLKWVNPYPGKKILSLEFKGTNALVSPFLLAVTGLPAAN